MPDMPKMIQLRHVPDALHRKLKARAALAVERHAHQDLMPRIWQLRELLTAYDGAYIALAEALDAPLLTCDAKLGRSHGHRAALEIVE
jgi:predicted nucleic acid-binding protein